MKQTYLGDGAYAEINEFNELVIFTSDGVNRTNSVVIEPAALINLFSFLQDQGWMEIR